MSLVDSTCQSTTLVPFEFCELFENCTTLVSAANLVLPANVLAEECYAMMFVACTSLIDVPTLSATLLANKCYYGMFAYCTSLTSVPKLPATTLASDCYGSMFYGCTSLIVSDTQTADAPYAWRIPSSGTFTNTTTYNQTDMFKNCLGTRSSDTMSGAYGESHTYYRYIRYIPKKFIKNSSGKFWKNSSGKFIYIVK